MSSRSDLLERELAFSAENNDRPLGVLPEACAAAFCLGNGDWLPPNRLILGRQRVRPASVFKVGIEFGGVLKGPTENGVFGVERVPGGKSFAPDNPRGPGAPREVRRRKSATYRENSSAQSIGAYV